MRRNAFFATFLGAVTLLPVGKAVGETTDLTELSLADLMNLKVTSVSKKEEKASEAAAAIYVITNDDIRRSGVNSIPEALRLAPGLNVARVNSSTWAITARGFNSVYANKLLVLIDGRSVYTPEFSGVFWDSQDILLEDVERIEVIRGPGATLWGANAVNGVINIITKKSSDTQGGLLSSGFGSEDKSVVGVRQGGKIGENSSYRVYGKYHATDESVELSEALANDEWLGARTGFRFDTKLTSKDSLTVQGDVNYGEPGVTTLTWSEEPPYTQIVANDRKVDGQNILARWSRTISDRSNLEAQLYFDRINRKDVVLNQEVNTIDFDIQHRYRLGSWNDIVYGFGYRSYHDDLECSTTLMVENTQRDFDLFTWFVQDEITVVPEKLRFILGSKFEVNDFTGFNYQPNARVVYLPAEGHTVWSAISRAVRTPSRLEIDALLNFGVVETPSGTPALVTGIGNSDLDTEKLLAYELGYRAEIGRSTFFDVTAFYNDYDDITSLTPGKPYVDYMMTEMPMLIFPLFEANKNEAETHGVEVVVDSRPINWWRIVGGYSFLNISIDNSEAMSDTLTKSREGHSPQHQFVLRSQFDLPRDVQFDTTYRFVSELKTLGVPDYSTVDVRLAWRPIKTVELSLIGQNLLEPSHQEYVSADYIRTAPQKIQRGVFGKVVWSW